MTNVLQLYNVDAFHPIISVFSTQLKVFIHHTRFHFQHNMIENPRNFEKSTKEFHIKKL